MGQRHNRKRTRSRPRNRDQGFCTLHSFQSQPFSVPATTIPTFTLDSVTPAQPSGASLFSNPPAGYWHQQYAAWHNRSQPQTHHNQRQHQHLLAQQNQTQDKLLAAEKDRQKLEAQQVRLFGGEAGDETSLCAPMLKVVMDLFDGIDYIDP